jgi:23S rRNA (cytosine1962-C5)-methyltransferase
LAAQIILKKGKSAPIEARHPWVFAASIGKVRGDPKPGDAVEVLDPTGGFLGHGYYNPRSKIAVRILSWEPDQELTSRFFRRRIAQAAGMRERIGVTDRTNAYRVVHSEGDGLAGLVVDRYGDYLVVQIATAGMAAQKEVVLDALEEVFSPKGIIGRPDGYMCELEGIKPIAGVLRGAAPARGEDLIIEEDGGKFVVDLIDGQKTGFFCDQRDARQFVGELAPGRRVLDCFCYTGAFAIQAARGGAQEVIAFETSGEALQLAGRNRQLNGARIVVLQGEVFWELQNLVHRGEKFGLIVLDPPKFVRDRDGMQKGLDGYRALNTLGMLLTEPGGILVTSSCSGLVDQDMFEDVLNAAAIEANREIQVIRRIGQAADHPVMPSCPESRYLKTNVCIVG